MAVENVDGEKSIPVEATATRAPPIPATPIPAATVHDDPTQWSLPKKIFHTTVPCLLAFTVTFTTSVAVPATGLIAEKFGVTRTQSTLVLTLYTLGIAFGPLLTAPLSEFVGRKYVYVGSCSALLAFIGGAGAAKNFATLLICRLFAGLLGSAGLAMGAGTIADVWTLGRKSGTPAMFFILGPFLGPTLGPIGGAYVLADHDNDWRWTQWVCLLVGAPVWLGLVVMKETSRFRVLAQTKDQSPSGKQQLAHTIAKRVYAIIRGAIVRPLTMLTTEPIVMSMTLYAAYAYAMIFSYFASSSLVLAEYYNFNAKQQGLSLISVIIGYVLAVVLFGVLDRTLYARACNAAPDGKAASEHRLYCAIIGGVLLPVALFWNAWEPHHGGHWAALVASGIPLGLGSFSIFISTITYLVETYRAGAAASALAANGSLRFALGATFPLFTPQMYENLGVHWAGSVFAFLSLLLLPIPYILFIYGHRLRAKSRFETSKA